MLPRGLLVGLCIGMLAGLIYGLFLFQTNSAEQLVFVQGPYISILTDKIDYNIGESIMIKIVNSGTVPTTFSDSSYGLEIKQLDGIVLFSPIASQVISVLEPNEKTSFVWSQEKNNGEQVLEGRYKIMSTGFDPEGNQVQKSVIINILK